MSELNYQHFHLVGIKGVAMTALAQILFDMNKKITGCDVPEDFVTAGQLKRIGVQIQTSLVEDLPIDTECVIYTAAHQSQNNPQVQKAIEKGLPIYSHAEALGLLFNEKYGVAVCGVGGKSTISAMISWVLEITGREPAFAVGVGSIIGLEKTGSWSEQSKYFVAEADEYVTDPTEKEAEKRRPRFSYLKPKMIVCSNVLHDHPDVYEDLAATKRTFTSFFNSLPVDGNLILCSATGTDYEIRSDIKIATYGTNDQDDFRLEKETKVVDRMIIGRLWHQNESFEIKLRVPGFFNLLNATAAFAACLKLDIPAEEILEALASFRSTKRRFEYLGEKDGVRFYDDYAHHPSELKAVISAFDQWEPAARRIVVFQPHTYSRTKALFAEFVEALSGAKELIILDIYASAREGKDSSISSEILAEAVRQKYPETKITLVSDFKALAEYLRKSLLPGDACITLGAGDIYQAHELLEAMTFSQELRSKFPEIDFLEEEPLASHTTVGIGGPAEVFCRAKTTEQLEKLVKYSRENKISMTVLGWGSNTLIADRGLRGLVIKNEANEIEVLESQSRGKIELKSVLSRWQHVESEAVMPKFDELVYDESDCEQIKVKIASGVPLAILIQKLLRQGITGLQWFARIPATVGGGIVNNIHGGTHFFSDYVESVRVVDKSGKVSEIPASELEFGYDVSRFHRSKEIILSATFVLYKGDTKKAQAVIAEWSRQKQQQPAKSLGCVFQNISPEIQKQLNLTTPSVGYLVDNVLGLKGKSKGGAQISDQHAAFIINSSNATADDYLSLLKNIYEEAKRKFDIKLKPEIFFLGFTSDELSFLDD